MILLLGLVTLLLAAHGDASVKGGRPSQVVFQDAHLGDDILGGAISAGPAVQSARKEVIDSSGRVQGTYAVSDPIGRTSVVHYAADDTGVVADLHKSAPSVLLSGKGGVSGARHVLDPVSQIIDSSHGAFHQEPVISVDPFSGTAIKTSSLSAPSPIQFTLGDAQAIDGLSTFGDPHYKIGRSQIPYGLSGSDYYSFPSQLYSPRRAVLSKASAGPIGGRGIASALVGGRLKGGAPITTVIQTPQGSVIGGAPVIATKVSPVGISGIGPGSIQFSLGDPSSVKGLSGGGRRLYTMGQSQIPYGLSGSDYYSFPSQLYSPRRNIKTIVSKTSPVISGFGGLGGLGGLGAGGQGAVVSKINAGRLVSGPGNIQFAIGDPSTVKGLGAISRDPLYKAGLSQIPFGLSGSDYYSFPSQLYAPRQSVKTVLSKTSGGIGSLGGIGAFSGGRKGGVLGGGGVFGGPSDVQSAVGDSLLGGTGLRGPIYKVGQSVIPYGLSGLDYYSYPTHLHTPRRTVLSKVSPGSSFGGIGSLASNLKGGTPVGSSLFGGASPGSIQFTLGGPSAVKGGRLSSPLYTIGQSQIPYGLSGSDYYSFPSQMYNPKRIISKLSRGGGSNLGIGALRGGPNIITSDGLLLDGQQKALHDIDPAISSQIPSSGFGNPSTIQFSLGGPIVDSVKGSINPVYRNGYSQVPFGLSGSDYYSYPRVLGGRGKIISGKPSVGITSPFIGGRPSGILKSIQEDIIDDALHGSSVGGDGTGLSQERVVQVQDLNGPGSIQFTLGDPATRAYGIQQSQVPFGLSGHDYYSYPSYLRPAQRVKTITKVSNLGGSGVITQIQEKVNPTISNQLVADPRFGGPSSIQARLSDPTGFASPVVAAVIPEAQVRLSDSGVTSGGLFGSGPNIVQQRVAPAVIDPFSGDVHLDDGTLGDSVFGQRKIVTSGLLGDVGVDPIIAPAIRVSPVRKAVKQVVRSQDLGSGRISQVRVPQAVVSPVVDRVRPSGIQFTLGDSGLSGGGRPSVLSRPAAAKIVPQIRTVDSGLVSRPQIFRDAGILGVEGGRPRGGGSSIEFTLGDSRIITGSPAAVIQPAPAPVRRVIPQRRVAAIRPAAFKVNQQSISRPVGIGAPVIEFNLGDSQIIGGHTDGDFGGRINQVVRDPVIVRQRPAARRIAPSRVLKVVKQVSAQRVSPVAQVRVANDPISSGIGTIADLSPVQVAVDDASFGSRPSSFVIPTSPARIDQERITAPIGVFGGPAEQIVVDDPRVFIDPTLASGGRPSAVIPARFSQGPISGLSPAGDIFSQEHLALTSDGLAQEVVNADAFMPRLSFSSQFPYDGTYSVPVATGFGLRKSALRSDPSLLGGALGQQKIFAEGLPLATRQQVMQEKVDQILVR